MDRRPMPMNDVRNECVENVFLVKLPSRRRLRNRPLAMDGFSAGTRLNVVLRVMTGEFEWDHDPGWEPRW